jgi:hypothetical protein
MQQTVTLSKSSKFEPTTSSAITLFLQAYIFALQQKSLRPILDLLLACLLAYPQAQKNIIIKDMSNYYFFKTPQTLSSRKATKFALVFSTYTHKHWICATKNESISLVGGTNPETQNPTNPKKKETELPATNSLANAN